MIVLLNDGMTDGRQELVHERFMAMLPRIQRQASLAFRHLGTEASEEMVQEVTANAYRAWVRLVDRGASKSQAPRRWLSLRSVRFAMGGGSVAG